MHVQERHLDLERLASGVNHHVYKHEIVFANVRRPDAGSAPFLNED